MMPEYYRNVISVEILSDQLLTDEMVLDLDNVDYLINEGSCSGKVTRTILNEQVSPQQMRELLTAQGSDPEFLVGEEES
jgi:hypothetical protein